VRGQIRLDGASLDQWTSDALGGHIGYLPQNIALLPGSIADNISRFDETASADDIIAAANAAHVHDIIVGLPDGYETLLKDPIVGLSTGQQQRIALARALYRDPFLVVLDEPSANLDPEGEAALLKAMIGIRQRGGIVVVIAHHPSTLAAVDTILILRTGKIDSIGPKDEVLSRVLPRHVPSKPLRIVSERAGGGE
jgi:ATP-binding cassette subfamily C protein